VVESGNEHGCGSLQEAALDALPHPVMVHDKSTVLYVNPAACRVFRASDASQLVGRPISDLVHPDGRPAGEERRRMVIDDGTTFTSLRVKLLAIDGTVVYASGHGQRITYNGTPAILVTGTLADQ